MSSRLLFIQILFIPQRNEEGAAQIFFKTPEDADECVLKVITISKINKASIINRCVEAID